MTVAGASDKAVSDSSLSMFVRSTSPHLPTTPGQRL